MHAITVSGGGKAFSLKNSKEYRGEFGKREENWECCDYIIILKRRKQKKKGLCWSKAIFTGSSNLYFFWTCFEIPG